MTPATHRVGRSRASLVGLLGLAAAVGSCAPAHPPSEGALGVTVELRPGAMARCVQVVVRSATAERASEPIPTEGRSRFYLALYASPGLEGPLELRARGLAGKGCDRLNVESEAVSSAFAEGELRKVTLELWPVPSALDADGDGYRGGAPNDPDCAPADPEVHPRLEPEPSCGDGKDDDCSGPADCADPACAGRDCGAGVCTAGRCGGPQEVCSNGADDDGDGLPDCADPDCAARECNDAGSYCLDAGSCGAPSREVDCSNGLSEDGDALVDCADLQDCLGASCRASGCILGSVCQADGTCGGGTAKVCPGSGHCLVGLCEPTDGGCSLIANVGAPCPNGQCLPDAGCSLFPFAPSNFQPEAISPADASVTLNCDATFDSTPGAAFSSGNDWCNQPLPSVTSVDAGSGVELAVLALRGLTLPQGRTLTVTGSRPVVFVVYGNAAVNGTVLGGARFEAAGPGGNGPLCGSGEGGAGAGSPTQPGGGGGGGAFGSQGGDGGFGWDGANLAGAPGAAGTSHGSELLTPLRGGCAGGPGGRGTGGGPGQTAPSGGGGGAVQFTVSGELVVNGGISVPGGGGRGTAETSAGAGGGGSGGAILLEASRLVVSAGARVYAHGGGGGEGESENKTGRDGENGKSDSTTPARGGQGGSNGGGNGGSGATGSVASTPGEPGRSDKAAGGGGGGGGVGRIRIQAPIVCLAPSVAFSPAPSKGPGCP